MYVLSILPGRRDYFRPYSQSLIIFNDSLGRSERGTRFGGPMTSMLSGSDFEKDQSVRICSI